MPFGKSAGGGRRRARRAPAPQLSVLSTVTTDHRVGLVNLSSCGVRVTAPDLPDEGEQVVFKAAGMQSFGHVVWSRNGQCGIAFDTPMPAEQVNRLRSEADMVG